MTSQEIEQIARLHSVPYKELTGIYEKLPTILLGQEIYHSKYDFDEYLKQLGWKSNEIAIYIKNDLRYHVFTALGYEELIRFMTNPKEYINEIPDYDWVSEYNSQNKCRYRILQYLLEFSLHYGIKFE